MSHFTVLVVTKEEPTKEVLGKELGPFHQFECTGRDDEYVQTIDITEEAIKEYKSQTTKMVVSEDGQYHKECL